MLIVFRTRAALFTYSILIREKVLIDTSKRRKKLFVVVEKLRNRSALESGPTHKVLIKIYRNKVSLTNNIVSTSKSSKQVLT